MFVWVAAKDKGRSRLTHDSNEQNHNINTTYRFEKIEGILNIFNASKAFNQMQNQTKVFVLTKRAHFFRVFATE